MIRNHHEFAESLTKFLTEDRLKKARLDLFAESAIREVAARYGDKVEIKEIHLYLPGAKQMIEKLMK